MPSLKHLDAPGNNFQEVPVHLLPESITTLNFASNRIKSLGDDMTCDVLLPNLTKLDLENNKDLFRLPMKLFTPRYVKRE
jgi:Leucine-rich repeat (LRR) protein